MEQKIIYILILRFVEEFSNFNIDTLRVIIYSRDILGGIDFGGQNKHKSGCRDRNIG